MPKPGMGVLQTVRTMANENNNGDQKVAKVKLTLIVPSTGRPTGRTVSANLKIHD